MIWGSPTGEYEVKARKRKGFAANVQLPAGGVWQNPSIVEAEPIHLPV